MDIIGVIGFKGFPKLEEPCRRSLLCGLKYFGVGIGVPLFGGTTKP